jgi:tetratricopeptide (TPR) repeat protein
VSIDRAKVLQTAQKYLAKGQLDRAIAEYNKLVKDQPKDARILLKVGDIYARKGDTAEASSTYHQVANLYADQGFFLKAVAVYKQILKLDANQIEALRRLGEMYEMLSLVSDALSTYEVLVTVLERAGKREDALEVMAQMTRLDPKNVAVCIRYAEALSKAERIEEAAEVFEEGSRLLLEQNRVEDYLKVGERLLYIRPDDLNLARELASRYLEQGDAKHALSKLQICFRANPKDIGVLELLAEAFRTLGQKTKAVSVYRQISRLHADAGRQSQQKHVLEKILELDPKDTEAGRELQMIVGGAPPRPSLSPEEADQELAAQAAAVHIVPELTQDEEPEVIPPAPGAPPPVGGPASQGLVAPATPSPPYSTPPSDGQIKRLLSECDVFIRYGLKDKALSQLNRILDMDPANVEARQKLKDLHLKNDEVTEALIHLLMLAEFTKGENPREAAGYLREALQLDPHNERAREELQLLESGAGPPGEDEIEDQVEVVDERGEEDEEIIFLDEGEQEEPEAEVITEEVTEAEAAEVAAVAAAAETGAEIHGEPFQEELPPEVEDALEEVGFYLSQGLLSEARDTLQDALDSSPEHPALMAKLREIEGLESAAAGEPEPAPAPSAVPARPSAGPGAGSTDSHYDLGLAYMEMELHDKSINEFKQCLANPEQRGTAHTMIGLCYVHKGEVGEAIEHFKEGLASPRRREAEEIELLFELGNAYQLLRKNSDALEYFRAVADRDPGFRDVRQRLEKLGKAEKPKDEIEEFDVLFDDLIVKE